LIVYDLSRCDLIPSAPHSDCFLVDDEGRCFPDIFKSYEDFERHLCEQKERER
jgi:hypothetical protein